MLQDRPPRPRPPGDLPDLVTVLLVDLSPGTGVMAEVVTDIALRCGATEVGPAPGSSKIEAVFSGVCDATRAAVEIALAARLALRGAGDGGPRIAVCTIESDPGGGPHRTAAALVAELLATARPGQILATASTAVVAGPTLPPGVDLVDSGLWTTTPAERIYDLVLDRTADGRDGDVAGSNLDWARRAAHGVPPGGPPVATASDWRDVVAGRGTTVLLTGGTPALRSTVSAELALSLHAEGAQILHGRWTSGADAPYRAFREALGVHAGGCSTEQLVADLDGWVDECARLLPEVGVRLGGTRGAGVEPARLSDAATFDAVEAWLRAVSGRLPTLLVLADAQWAEPASVRLLAHLSVVARRMRLLVLVVGDGGGDGGGSSGGGDASAAVDGRGSDGLRELTGQVDADTVRRIRLS